ncbi:MAG: ATP-binding protein [Phototrophicaceae bacterium]
MIKVAATQRTNQNELTEKPSSRFIILLGFIVIIIFLAAILLFINSRYQLQSTIAETTFRETVQNYDANLQLLLSNIDTTLKIVGAEIRLEQSNEEIKAFTISLSEQIPELEGIIVVDPSGNIISNSNLDADTENINVYDREYFQIHLDNRLTTSYISNPIQSRATTAWIIPISWGVYDNDDTLLAVLAASITPQYFSSSFGSSQDMDGFLLTDENTILTTIPYDEQRINQTLNRMIDDPLADTLIMDDNSPNTIHFSHRDGELAAHQHYPQYDLTLIFIQDDRLIRNAFYREVGMIVIASLAFMSAILIALVTQHRNTLSLFEQTTTLQLETKQRKLAENAVWKERNLLRTLIDNIPDYIFIKDREGRFIESNKAHTQATGVSYQNILNRRADQLFASPLAEQFQSDDKQVIHEGRTLVNEERITVAADGTKNWVLTSKIPLYDGKKIIGLVGISRNITDRKAAEEELRRNERRLQTIVTNMPAIIIECDPDGIIHMIEGSALAAVGLNADQLIASSILNLYGEYIDNFQTIFKKVTQGEEINHRLQIGDLIFDAYFIPRLNDHGELMSIISIANDVTASLDAERMNLQMEKERSLIEFKERFIATASHDFRNPLAVIKTKADVLMRYDQRLDASNRLQKLSEIAWQVDHMVSLLENILKVSEANMGAIKPDIKPLDLELFCKRVWSDMLETDATHTQTHFDYVATIELIHADEHLLQYALINVLSNAFKYTAQDADVRFSVRTNDEHVIFVVQDSGIGIPEADIHQLFEPFYRASNSPADKGKGLGLAIVKAYVEAHHGTISIISKENVGTTVTITLPQIPNESL